MTAATLVVAVLLALGAAGGQAPAETVDSLMRDVLARRDANRDALAAYTFTETESMELRGEEALAPVQSHVREFRWLHRNGAVVREPATVDGMQVVAGDDSRIWALGSGDGRQLSVDDFYDWDSFFNFRFEEGRYFFAGRGVFEGREVLRIEYYPRHLLSATDDDGYARKFDSTTTVTMLVDAVRRRIVAWDFETVGLEFMPLRWLARVSAMHVSMVLDHSPEGTWLPREIRLSARVGVATEQLMISLDRRFDDFVHVDTGERVETAPGFDAPSSVGVVAAVVVEGTIADVGFQGNHTTASDVLRAVAGVAPGSAYSPEIGRRMARRLLDSRLVDRVDVRPRHTALVGDGDVTLVVVVRETVPLFDKFLFMPMFEWSDEYGITVGARVSVVDLYGDHERLSFPLSIGGRDTVAVEYFDLLDSRVITGVATDFGYRTEINPHFNEPEKRIAGNGRAFKTIDTFQLEVEGGWADVDFMGARREQVSFAVTGRFDTRRQTGLPRNAVYLATAYNPLKLLGGGAYVNRFLVDVRGYIGLFGRSTLAVGATYDGADGPLPSYEQFLMGGLTTLRGYAPGQFIGDNRMTSSAELRMPVWEPFPVILLGIDAFWDIGAVWDHGTDLGKARFRNGVGGGVFLMAAFLQLNVDGAYGLDEGWQLHIGSGLRY